MTLVGIGALPLPELLPDVAGRRLLAGLEGLGVRYRANAVVRGLGRGRTARSRSRSRTGRFWSPRR